MFAEVKHLCYENCVVSIVNCQICYKLQLTASLSVLENDFELMKYLLKEKSFWTRTSLTFKAATLHISFHVELDGIKASFLLQLIVLASFAD